MAKLTITDVMEEIEEKIIESAKNFCEMEYQSTVRVIEGHYLKFEDLEEYVIPALQRCLGAVQYVETLGIAIEDLTFYDDYKEKFYALLEKRIDK